MKPNPMTPSGAARVLAAAASIDKRTIGEADAIAWSETLAWLEPGDCIKAVAIHYRSTDEYLMPAHIRRIARRFVTDRQEAFSNQYGIERSRRQPGHASAEVERIKAQLRSEKANREKPEAEPCDGLSTGATATSRGLDYGLGVSIPTSSEASPHFE